MYAVVWDEALEYGVLDMQSFDALAKPTFGDRAGPLCKVTLCMPHTRNAASYCMQLEQQLGKDRHT